MTRAVDMGLETAALLSKLADRGKGEYLESAAVGKYGPVPGLEAVKAARAGKGLQPRPEVEMISVAQDNLGSYVFLEVTMIYSLHGAYRPHRHEYGGMNLSVVRI